MDRCACDPEDRPAVAATPSTLAAHVAGLVGLPVFAPASDSGPDPDQPLLLVVTSATAASVIEGGLIEAVGRRLVGVVCWHVDAADLAAVLGRLADAGVPAFVGVPSPQELQDALAGSGRALDHEDDLLLARALARFEADLDAQAGGADDA